jgi:hypothetical protein
MIFLSLRHFFILYPYSSSLFIPLLYSSSLALFFVPVSSSEPWNLGRPPLAVFFDAKQSGLVVFFARQETKNSPRSSLLGPTALSPGLGRRPRHADENCLTLTTTCAFDQLYQFVPGSISDKQQK